MVVADLDDPDTLLLAFRGAHAIYATTDFFALTKYPNIADLLATKYSGLSITEACYQHELKQGKNMISAAAKAMAEDPSRLETLVLSTGSHASKWSNGNIKHLLHFDVKAHIQEYLRTQYSELAARTNFLMVGFYMSNIWFPFAQPQKATDGTFKFRWPPIKPDTVLPATYPSTDVGVFVKALLDAPYGTVLLGQSDRVTIQQLVELWAEATGKQAKLESLSFEQAVQEIDATMPGWGQEMAENILYYRDYGYDGGDPTVKRPADLGIKADELTSYKDYLKSQDWSSLL